MAAGLPGEQAHGGAAFRTTRWSVVINAGSDDSQVAATALEELCQRYWYPLYAWVRRSGCPHADACDLIQAFFARVVEQRTFAGVEPGGARFRAFLLTALKRFMINARQSANRLKRGGGQPIVSLEARAEEMYGAEPPDLATPDKLFEKRWAVSVIDTCLERLRAEFAAAEKPELFEALKPALAGEKLEKSYAEVAAAFGLSEGAVKVAVHRMRKRFGELLRSEVGETVQNPADVDDEVRYLFTALGA